MMTRLFRDIRISTCSLTALFCGMLFALPVAAQMSVVTGGTVGVGTSTPDTDFAMDVDGDTLVQGHLVVDRSSSLGTTELSPAVLDFTRNGTAYIDQTGGGSLVVRTGSTTLAFTANFDPNNNTRLYGELRVDDLTAAGGATTQLCQGAGGQIAACTSSSRRYKTEIRDLASGLDVVEKLRPVSFMWKEGGNNDFGFIAEEVAAIDKLFAVYSDEGEIEGVKYRQLVAVLTNAIKEQQRQIERLEEQVAIIGTER